MNNGRDAKRWIRDEDEEYELLSITDYNSPRNNGVIRPWCTLEGMMV